MSKKISLIAVLMLLALTVFGCGKKEELQNNPSSSLVDIINEEEVVDEECPEGYVYDYQVSMEPIPEEIAALGGDVCGTIHAYPTRIEIALAKQEIENDEELQEQNEKNIKGVQQYLADTYGGEFEIEPLTTGIWSYMCTEQSTGKSFIVYISTLYKLGISDEAVELDTYFYEDNAKKYGDDISAVLSENFQTDYYYKARYECIEDFDMLYIKIAIFKEGNIDYLKEQEMIIKLFDKMKELLKSNDKEVRLGFTITYFQPTYRAVIAKQYQSNNIFDMAYIYGECADKLLYEKEILAQFEYHESKISDEDNMLQKMSNNKDVYYENECILPYWRKRNE